MVQFSHPYMTTRKTIALTRQTFAGKTMSLIFNMLSRFVMGFPGGSDSKESAWNAGDPCSVSGLGRSPGGGNGNPLQYSCLDNPMVRGAWQCTVHRVAKSQTWLKWPSTDTRILGHSPLTSLCFSHLTCKLEIVIVVTLKTCFED